MKRILFIFLILLVMGVVGLYVFLEFRVPDITYVSDATKLSSKGNEAIVYRLYTSGIDIDAFTANVENSLVSTEFTEDEIYAAAIASGEPQFYPAFYFKMYHPDVNRKSFLFEGAIRQAFARNQKEANFNFTNVHLELVSDGLDISSVDYTLVDNKVASQNAPVVSEDKRSMVINLDNVSFFNVVLDGASGMLTFQYTYDIVSNGIFPNTVLYNQLLIVYMNVKLVNDAMEVEYISEPYSSLEEFAEY